MIAATMLSIKSIRKRTGDKDLTLAFRASRNQRIIDMNKTRSAGSIVLKEFA